MKNAQHLHKVAENLFASNLPTTADRDAYAAWQKASPAPERVPDLHRMEAEAHSLRLRDTLAPDKH